LEKLAHDALRGRSLAAWLKESTSRRQGGGKNLDKLYRSGALRKRIEGTLTDKPASLSGPVVAQSRLGPAVPLINKVAAGYPTDFTDLDYPARIADEYVACPALNDPDAFAASVVGESMMPEYREGDIVIFSPLAKVVDGCDCFVRLEPDHETTFKRVFIDEAEGTIRLQPLNPVFPPVLRRRDEVAGMYRAVWRFSRL
jgi:phage repressor protein C with HTH and peptisase S24 domain